MRPAHAIVRRVLLSSGGRGAALRRLAGDRSGAAAVEFAIILPVFLTMLLGVFEFGTYMWVRNTIQFAAEEGARYAMANTTASTAAVEAATRAKASALDASKLTVTVQQVSDNGTIFVVISTSYTQPGGFLSPFLGIDLSTASGSARVPIVQ